MYAIRRADGLYYTHGYPSGTWAAFPRAQFYLTQGTATRQANKINTGSVVKITVEEGP